ncbi:hypothetical protein [Halobaculum sp. CBA1158]|nr:hypothetical protein [Halobaculum sp. CBA1158]
MRERVSHAREVADDAREVADDAWGADGDSDADPGAIVTVAAEG